MIKVTKNGVDILESAEGKYLTQKTTASIDDRLYVKAITLGGRLMTDFREATQKEKEDYETALINKPIS